MPRQFSQQHRLNRFNKRRIAAEQLENRLLLTADLQAESSMATYSPPGLETAEWASGMDALGEGESQADAGPQRGATSHSSFAEGLRRAVREISRIVDSVNSAPEMLAEIPYLGGLLPDSVGGMTVIDTSSLQSLFRLAERFDSEVTTPLEDFLNSNPNASVNQLTTQFAFLEPATGLSGGQQGVRLVFNPREQLQTNLASLFEPILGASRGLIEPTRGDALATDLPLAISAEGLEFDIVRESSASMSISLPSFSLNVEHEASQVFNLAANVGFLAGTISGGEFDFDLSFTLSPSSHLFGESDHLVYLESLSELSSADIRQGLPWERIGEGLELKLPFDFNLAGFNPVGSLPIFALHDSNPIDEHFPRFDLQIPPQANYSAESLLGFHAINSTHLVGALDQLGAIFGAWEQGTALDFPVPLASNLSLGEAMGLAESYGRAVTQFLTDAQGFPAFNSVQELADLIPGVGDGTAQFPGGGPLSYDPTTQLLTLSLDFFRTPEPITGQADLSLLAGQSESPLASIEMNAGESGIENRLTVTRNAALGLQLQIDLSGQTPPRPLINVSEMSPEGFPQSFPHLRGWTSMATILERYGMLHLANVEQTLDVTLRNGSTVTFDMGTVDRYTSLDQWVQRGKVYEGDTLVAEIGYQANQSPFSNEPGEFDFGDLLFIRDLTTGPGTLTAQFDSSDEFWDRLFTSSTPNDNADNAIVSLPLVRAGALLDVDSLLQNVYPLDTVGLAEASDPLLINFRDGTSSTINFGPLAGKSLQDFRDAFPSDRLQVTTRSNALVFTDLTNATSDGQFSIAWNGSGGSRLLERFVPIGQAAMGEANLVRADVVPALPYAEVSPVDSSTTLGRLFRGTEFESIFGTESTASIELRDGSTALISSGVLTPETRLQEVASTLLISEGDQILLAARMSLPWESDQMVLIDQSEPDGISQLRLTDMTDGLGIYQILFGDLISGTHVDQDGDGRLLGNSLANLPGGQLEPLRAPEILVDPGQPVPAWARVSTIVERLAGNPSQRQVATASLRDGTEIELRVENPYAMTVGDVAKQSKFFSGNDLIAEIKWDGSGLSLHDYTNGSGDLELIQGSSFWFRAFHVQANAETPNILQPARLSQTYLEFPDFVTMDRLLAPESPFLDESLIGAQLQIVLPGRTDSKSIVGFKPADTRLEAILEALTIRQDGQPLTQARVINDRIEVEYLGDEDGELQIEWLVPESDPIGVGWLSQFVPVGVSGPATGQKLVGGTLIPALPSPDQSPIDDQSTVIDSIRSFAFADQWNGGAPSTATVQLRDGSTVQLDTGMLDQELTWSELADRLSVDGRLQVTLKNDVLVLVDLTTPQAGNAFSVSPGSNGTFFTQFGLTASVGQELRQDSDGDGRLESHSLATHRITPETTLGEIYGDDPTLFEVSDSIFDEIVVRVDMGVLTFINMSDLTPQTTLQQVADEIQSENTESETRFITRVTDGRFVITELVPVGSSGNPGTSPINPLQIQTTQRQPLLETWFNDIIDARRTGELSSNRIGAPVVNSRIDEATRLGDYLRAHGLSEFASQQIRFPVNISFQDGSTERLFLSLQPAMTLADVVQQLEIRRDGQLLLDADIVSNETVAGIREYRFVLNDRTEPQGDHSFSILPDTNVDLPVEAILATLLGLTGIDNSGAGVLVGPVLGANQNSAADRVRIRLDNPPQLWADLGIAATNLNAEARVGELLAVGIQNGNASATASIDIGIKAAVGQDYITLAALSRSMTHPSEYLEVNIDAHLQAETEFFVDILGLNEQPTGPSEVPRIDFSWTDLISTEPNLRFNTDGFSFTSQNLEQMLRFPQLRVEDVAELIRKVVDFVERLTGDDLLGKRLPLINKSLEEVLDTVDYVSDLVDQIQQDPNATLDTLESEIETLLGLEPDEFTLTYDPSIGILRADLDLSLLTVNDTASFNLDLSNLGLSQLDNFAEEFADLSAAGNFGLTVDADLRIHLGLDLDQFGSTEFDDAVVVYDTSGLFAEVIGEANDLQFQTSILSLGIAADGRAVFDRDGLKFAGGAESTEPADFRVTANGNWPDGRKPLVSLLPTDFQLIRDAAAGVDLQLSTLTANPTTDDLQVKWDDLGSVSFDVLSAGQSIDDDGGNQIRIPDLSEFLGDLTLADGLVALASGLQGLFQTLDEYLGDEILGVPVPLIGDALSDAVSFVDSFVGPVANELSHGADPGEAIASAGQRILFETLGPGPNGNGLNLIRDANGDGQITLADVGVVINQDEELAFSLDIGQTGIESSADIDLGVGGSGLGLELTGSAHLTAGYGLQMVVGFNLDQGPFVEFATGNEISLDFHAGIDDVAGQARLGPLAVTVETIPASELSEEQRRRARIDPDDPTTQAVNAVRGSFGIDLPTGRYTLSNLGSAFSSIDVSADFVGSLYTRINTGVNTSIEGIPTLVADLNMNFDRATGSLSEVFDSLTAPQVALTDVGLDLGSFVSNVLAPVLDPVNDFLDPIRPVLEQLTSNIPVLSDLIGPTTYVDLISLFGEGGETVSRFVTAISEIITLIDIPTNSDTIVLPLGNFDTVLDPNTGRLQPVAAGGSANFDNFVSNLDESAAEMKEYLQNIPQEEPSFDSQGRLETTPGKFSIPLLQDPTSAIGLLFGQDVDLIKYQAPQLNVGFEFQVGIPVYPIFNITIGGQLGAVIDFAFGYDTAGIFDFAESGRALDLINGFYFDDRASYDASGNKLSDVPELTFRFAVTAGGELDLKAAKAGVEIGIGAALLLDLNDPNVDGKVRFDEVLANLQLGNAPGLGPLWIFDASGQLDAFMTAYVKAFGMRVQATLGPQVLVNYDFPRPEPANPVLGHVTDDGTLVVHVGPNADLREEGNTDDGDELIFVSTHSDTGRTVITGFGTDQSFAGVQRVNIEAGGGDDEIIIEEDFSLPVFVDGGTGDDYIQGGAGSLTAYGGPGDNTIIGGSGNDILYGRPENPVFVQDPLTLELIRLIDGDNLIDGGDGDDQIFGGEGDDQLQGGGGDDTIESGAGDDYLDGGDGNDLLRGGEGHDVLVGGNGNDSLFGDLGNDFLQGGNGNDSLDGGAGRDELFGGMGADVLTGGADNDLLVGGIVPPNNPDYALLQASPDLATNTYHGGEGNNRIYGTAGTDIVTSGSGRNHVFTFGSDDVISTGSGDDLIDAGDGNNTVTTAGGLNKIYARNGFQTITSGPGADLIDLRSPSPIPGSATGSQINVAGGSNRIYGTLGDDIVIVGGSGSNLIDLAEGDNNVQTGGGPDIIRTGSGNDTIQAGNGNNEVSSGAGNDIVTTGSGNDYVLLGSGDDDAETGAGNDVILAGSGDDFVDAGSGDDSIRGGQGNDVLIGGFGNDTVQGDGGNNILWGGVAQYSAEQLRSSLVVPVEYSASTSAVEFPALVPAIVAGDSIPGSFQDGNDILRGGSGNDILFGGGGSDLLTVVVGSNYLDGGRGNDEVIGGDSFDVIRGGGGDDDLRGGAGVDFIYGDEGDDFIRGDAGIGIGVSQLLYGQKLFGGPGNDLLWAYAPTFQDDERSTLGDYLEGGSGADTLLGNVRREVFFGGSGDDFLSGDGLRGPLYGLNPQPAMFGGDDELYGDSGNDLLLGHGGSDQLWGGAGNDELEGHDGQDLIYGGSNIDMIRFDVDPRYTIGDDTLDGHFDDAPGEGVPDDDATDILVIPGTVDNDEIILAGDAQGQLIVHYNGRQLPAAFRDIAGRTLLEQFQIDGFDGDDTLGFDPSLDLTDLAERSRDWIGVINGGGGNDTLSGSAGRDRLDGGRGSDVLYGNDGDDRLWGDSGTGSSSDVDTLFAGSGNDDLLGGVGVNYLYAWSRDPGKPGDDFGVFIHPLTGELSDTSQPGFVLEDTGLNRMLGRGGDDFLYGGTGLDFLYGGDGEDVLHDVSGLPFESSTGVPEEEQWIEYARSTDKVWYYGGSSANDIITVDFVTEPGLLGGHHLITRLTENNGRFTFDARVQLDFAATHPDGTPVWDPNDLVYQFEQLNTIDGDSRHELAERTSILSRSLLPPEGDYLAIIVDAKEGDDQVYVGPTVQRSVWVAAGDGDDRVEIADGTAILVDLADFEQRNESAGDIDNSTAAYELGTLEQTQLYSNLTLDNPVDVDWFKFTLDSKNSIDVSAITVDSLDSTDQIELQVFRVDAAGRRELLATGDPISDAVTIDPEKPARVAIDALDGDFTEFTELLIRVRSLSEIPTVYDLGVQLNDGRPLDLNPMNLGVQNNAVNRRDVIVGGSGNDVLLGGPGEDWIIGSSGSNVIAGGADGYASDILIGGTGNDVFQVIPSDLGEIELTLADEIDGGGGYNRILYLGGDIDELGRPVPDHVSLRYDANLGSYHLAALVWDTANQRFLTDGDRFVQHGAVYNTRNIAATMFDLRGGDDKLYLEPEYYFPTPSGGIDESMAFGINAGDRQAGGEAINFSISGGAGNDRIFGSPYGDVICADAGFDLVVGGGDADTIDGASENDLLIGGDAYSDSVPLLDDFETTTVGFAPSTNDTLIGATELDLSSGPVDGLTLHHGDRGDWYLVPVPPEWPISDPALLEKAFAVDFATESANTIFDLGSDAQQRTFEVLPAAFDPSTGGYVPTEGVPEKLLLHVRNPMTAAVVADGAPATVSLNPGTTLSVSLIVRLERGIGTQRNLLFDIENGMPGETLAARINSSIESNSLSERVQALYLPELNRLGLLALDGSNVSVSAGEPDLLRLIGFTSGQDNNRAPVPLGTYQLSTKLSFPSSVPQGPELSWRPYEYAMATADPFVIPPQATFDLSDPQASLSTMRRIEGVTSSENLSEIIPIGDVNGDGRNDVILLGNQAAYVFLGDLDPSPSTTSAQNSADLIIDLRGGYRPIAGVNDVDGDGLDDIAFWQLSDPNGDGVGFVTVSMLRGVDLSDQPLRNLGDRMGQRRFAAEERLLTVTSFGVNGSFQGIDFQWLRFNDDPHQDLMAIARTPIVQSPATSAERGYGYVMNGQAIAEEIATGPPSATAPMMLAFINDDHESGAVIAGSLDPQTLDSADLLSRKVIAAPGDIDGDGLDEIVLVKPRGWTYEPEPLGEIVAIARTYVLDTAGGSNLDISLGGANAPAQLQHIEVALPDDSGATLGPLNNTTPLIVEDLDGDGLADLVLARSVELGDLHSDALLVYRGQQLSAPSSLSADNTADADQRIRGLTPEFFGLLGLDLSVGDFDGDRQLDLAIGQPANAAGNSNVSVLFDVMGGAPERDVADAIGDDRIDFVRFESIALGMGLGTLPSRSFDVTGNRIDDLLVGAPFADTTTGLIDGGRVYLIAGSQRRIALPAEGDFVELANKSIRGLGDVIDGRLNVIEADLQLQANDPMQWVRFTTVGDGDTGQSVTVGPNQPHDVSPLIAGIASDITASGAIRTGRNEVEVGGDQDRTGVIEFDLSSLLSAYENSSEILDASITLAGSGVGEVVDLERPESIQQVTRTASGGGFGERVFFEARTDNHGFELWVTDGTASGTSLAFEFAPGPDSGFPFNIAAVGHRVMFTVREFVGEGGEGGEVGDEGGPIQHLFLSDGVTTTEVQHPQGFDWDIQNFTLHQHDGSIYFINDLELYRARVDSSTEVTVTQLTNFGDFGAFTAGGMQSTAAGLFISRQVSGGHELVVTDGTAAGTGVLQSFNQGGRSTLLSESFSLGIADGVLFSADPGDGNGNELWFSDGTRDGTVPVADVSGGAGDGIIYGFQEFNGQAYFFANESELWQSDGTTDGTKLVRQLYTPTQPLPTDSAISLVAGDLHVSAAAADRERITLTSTDRDGTEVQSRHITAGERVHLNEAIAVGEFVLVSYNTLEAFFTDATDRVAVWDPARDTLTELINESELIQSYDDLTALGDRAIFSGLIDSSTFSDQLYVTDLSQSGTNPLIEPGGSGSGRGGSGRGADASVQVNIFPASSSEFASSGGFTAEPIFSKALTLSEDNSEFTLDLAPDAKSLASLRQMFERGYQKLAASFTVTEGAASISAPKTSAGQGLRMTRDGGASAMLLDDVGRVIAADFNHYDLRHLTAGTYYLGISRADTSQLGSDMPLSVRIAAPSMGAMHRPDDNDLIRGGDGNDVLVGGDGRNQIYGESGDDHFVAEFFEPRDRTSQEVLLENFSATRYIDSMPRRLDVDPHVLIAAAEVPDDAINIADPALAQVIADALGVRIIQRDGSVLFANEVYASDLARLTSLDASEIGLQSPDSNGGFEFLLGMQTLDLSDNQLRAGVLNRLLSADAGALGMSHLRHLNLNNNRIGQTANLAGLFSLRVLSMAAQDNVNFTGLSGLENLNQLVYLDVSGNLIEDVSAISAVTNLRSINVSDNPVTTLAPLSGSVVLESSLLDLSPAGDWLYSADESAVGGSSYLSRFPSQSMPSAVWPPQKLPAGSFDVLVNWHADTSHDPRAVYEIFVDGEEIFVELDQRVSPDASSIPSQTFGGQAFAILASIKPPKAGSVVEVSVKGSGNGILVADALMFRATAFQGDALQRINARRTSLDAASRELIVDDLSARDVMVDLDPNAVPVWSGLPTEIAMPIDDGYLLGNLNDFASDPEGTPLTFTLFADDPSLTLSGSGSTFKLSTTSAVNRPIQMLLTATDADGLSATHPITVVSGASLVSGRVTDDGDPVEGVVVYADRDGSKERDGGERFAMTSRDGTYHLLVDDGNSPMIRVEKRDDLAVLSENGIPVSIGTNEVIGNVDLDVGKLQIEMPDGIAEGTAVVATHSTSNALSGIDWSITGGESTIDSNVDGNFEFTPLRQGTYTVTLKAAIAGQNVTATRDLVVTPVAADANSGLNVTIPEGRWTETRTVVVDPGADVWDIEVDYGDGSGGGSVEASQSREFTFDHFYRVPGDYTVTVTVRDEFGKSSDTFDVTVTDVRPEILLNLDESFRQGGQQGGLDITILDPSQQLDPFRYQTTIDWGDEAIEDLSALLSINADRTIANETFSHNYRAQGSFEATVAVTDDDGNSISESIAIEVANDLPRVELVLPSTFVEGVPGAYLANVTDADPIASIEWDFGDESEPRFGPSVSHVYGSPGRYVIQVNATDTDGEARTQTATVTVANVDQPPTISQVVPMTITETIPWSFPMTAVDPDSGDTIAWSLTGEPVGMTIDPSGLIQWTPIAQQGPANYQLDVIATDQSGAQSSTMLSIDVIDTGSIAGELFNDLNGDGQKSTQDQVASGFTVTLDQGDNGIVDRAVQVDAEGNYLFDGLPIGLYRVCVADLTSATTPATFLVDMTVPREIELTPIGLSGELMHDSDEDGVSNFDEINSSAGIDGNGDGTPDWQQGNVATLETDGGAITIVAPTDTRLSNLTADPAVLGPSSTAESYPYGKLRFDINNLPPGERAQVELILHGSAEINLVYQVLETPQGEDEFREIGASGSETSMIANDRVLLELDEGGPSDVDGSVDGVLGNSLQLADVALGWTNPSEPTDVNDDGVVTPIDALLIINALNASDETIVLSAPKPADAVFLDANGDGFVTPIDALLVINRLNRRGT